MPAGTAQDGLLRPVSGGRSQPPGTTVRIPGGAASTPVGPEAPGTTVPIAGGAASTPVAPQAPGTTAPIAGGAASTPLPTQPAGTGTLGPRPGVQTQPPGTTVPIPGGAASTPSARQPPGSGGPIAGGWASTPVGPQAPGTTVPIAGGAASTPIGSSVPVWTAPLSSGPEPVPTATPAGPVAPGVLDQMRESIGLPAMAAPQNSAAAGPTLTAAPASTDVLSRLRQAIVPQLRQPHGRTPAQLARDLKRSREFGPRFAT